MRPEFVRLPRLALLAAALAVLAACASPGFDAPKESHPVAGAARTSPGPAAARPSPSPSPLPNTAPQPQAKAEPSAPLAEQPEGDQPLPLPGDEDNRDAIGTITDGIQDIPVDVRAAQQGDLWGRLRKGFAMPDLVNEGVASRERWYASQPDYVERMSRRGGRYLYHILQELEARKMPTELALLPFVESAMNPVATSSARAQGLWQFMPATGRVFDLKQNIFRDDRRDVLASTRGALDYLQRLHAMFGDWHLALASYNWGEGNVKRAIARNRAEGLPTDYDSLRMPAETRQYVPKLQALKNIVREPQAFGLSLIDLPDHPYFVSVPIQRDIDVDLAARLAGLSPDQFRELNPSMKKPVILAAGTPQVLLPYDNAGDFKDGIARHRGPLASWTAWVVPKTMKTREAADRVGMDEDELRRVNAIPPRMLVRGGSTLLVERAAHRSSDVTETIADNASLGLAPDVPPRRRIAITVGRGDTIAGLARHYRIGSRQLAQWNRLSVRSKLRRGQVLFASVPYYAPTVARPQAARDESRTVRKVVVDRRGKRHVITVVQRVKAQPVAMRAVATGKKQKAGKTRAVAVRTHNGKSARPVASRKLNAKPGKTTRKLAANARQ